MSKKAERIKWIAFSSLLLVFTLLFVYRVNEFKDLKRVSTEFEATNDIGAITKNRTIYQKFKCENNSIQGISIYFHNLKVVNEGIVNIVLKEENKIISEWNINLQDLSNDQYYTFMLDKRINEVSGKEFTIEITSNLDENNDAISIFKNDEINSGNLSINLNEVQNGTLCFKIIYTDLNREVIFITIAVIITIIFILLMIGLGKFKIKEHNIYLILALIITTGYFISLPLLSIPDESGHFFRAYEISEGYFISDKNEEGYGGRELPKNLAPFAVNSSFYDISQVKDIELSNETEFYGFANLSLYSPISYAAQSIGILIGRIITKSPILIGYLGRLMNCLTIILITYLSIKYIPIGKKLMIIIALLPMNVHQAISLSPDSMVTALSFALISFILYLRSTKDEKLNRKQIVLVYILAIVLSLYKIVYLPFCLLLFLIPKEKFKSQSNYIMHIVILGLLVIVVNLGWLAISANFLFEFQPGVNTADQIKYILMNPFRYIYVLFTTVMNYGFDYLLTMIGYKMGWLSVTINELIIFIYLVLIVVTAIFDNNRKDDDTLFRWLMISTVGTILLLTFTSIYVQWTAVGSKAILGIQGRYFIPLLVPFLLAIQSKNVIVKDKDSIMKYIYIVAVSMNLCIITSLFYNYII